VSLGQLKTARPASAPISAQSKAADSSILLEWLLKGEPA
jgi:hypothetical protein